MQRLQAAAAAAQDQALKYLGLGFLPPAGALVGFFFGAWLDLHFGTGRVFAVVFLLLGAIGGLSALIREASRK